MSALTEDMVQRLAPDADVWRSARERGSGLLAGLLLRPKATAAGPLVVLTPAHHLRRGL
jgi:hypothetical protein